MSNQIVPIAAVVPIEVEPLIDALTGNLATGLTNIKARVRRFGGGAATVLDWADMTFKAAGSVGQLLAVLTAVDDTNFPGEYNLPLDLGAITNALLGDVYHVTVIEDGSSTVGNLPQSGDIRNELALDDATLSRKFLGNRQDLSEGSTDNMEIKDDDGVTLLASPRLPTGVARWDVQDKNTAGITIGTSVPAIRKPS
jgi:hypothetical protein